MLLPVYDTYRHSNVATLSAKVGLEHRTIFLDRLSVMACRMHPRLFLALHGQANANIGVIAVHSFQTRPSPELFAYVDHSTAPLPLHRDYLAGVTRTWLPGLCTRLQLGRRPSLNSSRASLFFRLVLYSE